jgi:hypothetical protein
MKKLLLLSLALGAIALTASPAQAHGLRRACRSCASVCSTPCYIPRPQYTIAYEDRVVTRYKQEWKQREVPVTYQKPVIKEVTKKVKVTNLVPEYKDEKRTVPHFMHEKKEVEREVTRCVRVRVCYVDPCTGCTYTQIQRQLITEKVKGYVWECIPHKKEVVVKVCTLKPVTKEVEIKQRICEYETVKGVRTERYCELVPYQTIIRVAVCVPVPCVK